MEKIKLIVDSGSDITKEQADQYDIEVVPISIVWGDKVYRDWYDLDRVEFYGMITKSENLPTTSQATPEAYLNAFSRAKEKGYNRFLYIGLNSRASGSYQSSVIARELFLEDEANAGIEIELIDSANYSYIFGGAVMDVARKMAQGVSFGELVAFARDRISRVEAFGVVYTLEFLKRTGRINSISGFVGELFDIKPILRFVDGELNAVEKVRGRKRSVIKLLDLVKKNIDPESQKLFLMVGDMEEEEKELMEAIDSYFPSIEIDRVRVGNVITVHSGPKIIAIGYYRKPENIKNMPV